MARGIAIYHGLFGRVAILEMTKPLVVHAHSSYHLLFKLGGQDTEFGVMDSIYPVSDEYAIAVNTWEPHHYPHPPGIERTDFLTLYLDPIWLAANWGNMTGKIRFPQSSIVVTPHIRKLTNLLAAELVYSVQTDAAFIEEMVIELLRVVVCESQSETDQSENLYGPIIRDSRIRRSIAYMKEHLGDRLELEKIARESALSRPQFFELFRRHTHLTPSVYWNMLRMEHAIEGLTESHLPINYVAANIGFNAQSNFTRFFRHNQGISPREYRRVAQSLAVNPGLNCPG